MEDEEEAVVDDTPTHVVLPKRILNTIVILMEHASTLENFARKKRLVIVMMQRSKIKWVDQLRIVVDSLDRIYRVQ